MLARRCLTMPEIETPWDNVNVHKSHSKAHTNPSEDAAVVALAVAGAPDTEIAKTLDRSLGWVRRHKQKMALEIAEHRKYITEDIVEDYTDIITLVLFEFRKRLADPEKAANIKDNDLATILKNVFTSRQLILEAPTKIEGVASGNLKGRDLVDALATAEAFNERFDAMMKAQIEAGIRDLDVVDAEVEEIEEPDAGNAG